MKKIILASLLSLVLFSCNKEKKTEKTEEKAPSNEYVVTLDAIFEKDDKSMLCIYDENGNEILDKRILTDVKGSPVMQQVVFKLPAGFSPFNLGLGLSTSKEQSAITLKNITIKNKENTLIGGPDDSYLAYFTNNDCVVIDAATLKHTLKHDKEYPPGLVGNDVLISMLSK